MRSIQILRRKFKKEMLLFLLIVISLATVNVTLNSYVRYVVGIDTIWGNLIYVSIILLILALFFYLLRNKNKKLESSIEEVTIKNSTLETILENMNDGVVACDVNGKLIFFNQRAHEIHGLPQKPITPEQWGKYYRLYREDAKTPLKTEEIPLYHALQGEVVHNQEMCVKTSNEEVKDLLVTGKQMIASDEVIGAIVVLHDFTERKEKEKEIEYLAYHDTLTGLPNRRNFKRLIQQKLDVAEGEQYQIAVMFIDLDDFKLINDTLGHDKGDLYLQNIAELLKKCIRENDVVARMGGDEFTAILTDISKEETQKISENILKEMSKSILIDGNKLSNGLSMGISIYPNDGDTATKLMKNADIAMYHVKEHDKNNYMFYEPHMKKVMYQKFN